ncbi:hypothetical protein [Belliella pelovolcani]|uniref:hypothetical protein n=1 Tax=Belliella pelovolcani TaxID=529505 RepID=UPI00391C1025
MNNLISNAGYFLTFILIILIGCTDSSSKEGVHMSFEDVEFITGFPLEFNLNERFVPKVNNVGLREIKILDNYLILEKMGGSWAIYSLPDLTILGSFLKRGDGPLEFMQGPSLNKVSFEKENDDLIAYLYDFQKGRAMKFNVSQSLSSKEQVLSEYESKLPPFSFSFAKLDSNTFFVKELGTRDTQQLRYIIKNGQKESLDIADELNQTSIREGEDFNILSTLMGYSGINDRIVEAPIGLNNINIYSIDGSFAKTICLGEGLSDITKIQSQFRWNRLYTFANLTLFKDFFGVVFINEDDNTYQLMRKKLPCILLFDYNGKPLTKIQTGKHFTSFDIDFVNQELYTFDVHSDEFFKYDFKEVISKL